MSPEELQEHWLKGTAFEDDLSRDQNAQQLNEDDFHAGANNYTVMDPLRGIGKIEGGLFALFGAVLGLIFGAFGAIGGAVALRKLKNLMSRAVYWTEFGNDRGGKGKSKNTSNYKNDGKLWSTFTYSETDKDKESFASNVASSSRALLVQTEQLREMMGI